jgi:uncharacterized protein
MNLEPTSIMSDTPAPSGRRPTVAVIGASNDRSKYGNKSVRAHQAMGYDVYPVNPRGGEIEGLVAYARIEDVPVGTLDRVSMYVPPGVGLTLLPAIASRQPAELWLNPGSESEAVIAAAEQLGLNPIVACSIVDLGTTPAVFGD